MAKSDFNMLKAVLLLQIVLAVVKANELIAASASQPVLNVTTSLEDYISQVDRQYAQLISSDAAIVDEFRTGYERQLSAVDAQRFFLENELIAIDQKLYPLEYLDELSKHCVQKYRRLLYTISAVRQNFVSCISQSRSNLNSILTNVDSNIRSLNSLYNINFKNGILDCDRKNKNSYTNQTRCILDLFYSLSVSFNTLQSAFLANLDTAHCGADTRIRQTVECSFTTVNQTLTSIGSTTTLINNCIAGLEFCEPCQNQNHKNNNNPTICPNVINLISGRDIYRNDTIRNPFVGLNSTLDCILVNFSGPN